MDLASEALSLHAFAELADKLSDVSNVRLVLPPAEEKLGLFGSEADRAARNRLQGRWLARRCADWIERAAEVRRTECPVPQGAVVLRNGDGHPGQAVLGSFSFSTDGLGLAPGNPLNLIHASETPEESRRLSEWFDGQWSALAGDEGAKTGVVELLRSLAAHHDPHRIYALILNHLFRTGSDELDAEQVVKSATGIRNTVVWTSSSSSSATASSAPSTSSTVSAAASSPTAWDWARPSRRWPSSSTTSCETTGSWFFAPNACATTGASTAPTTAAISSRATASTTTSSTTPTCRATAACRAISTSPTSTGGTTTSSSSTSPTTSATSARHDKAPRRATTG